MGVLADLVGRLDAIFRFHVLTQHLGRDLRFNGTQEGEGLRELGVRQLGDGAGTGADAGRKNHRTLARVGGWTRANFR